VAPGLGQLFLLPRPGQGPGKNSNPRPQPRLFPSLNRKSQVDINLGESFNYLPCQSICVSQNMVVNIYCNSANELLCLSELSYPRNMDLFAFLTVMWQHVTAINLHSQCPSVPNFWDLGFWTTLPNAVCTTWYFSLGLLHKYHLNSLHLGNIYSLYGVSCLFISYAEN